MKKHYMKPSMKVYELQHRSTILCGSPNDGPQWFDEPGDDPQF